MLRCSQKAALAVFPRSTSLLAASLAVALAIAVLAIMGCQSSDLSSEVLSTSESPVIKLIDCAVDEDFHWGGHYPEHSGEVNTKYIHEPDGKHCEGAWCRTCLQFVCITYRRH